MTRTTILGCALLAALSGQAIAQDAVAPDAANADEVNGSKLRRQFHGVFPL